MSEMMLLAFFLRWLVSTSSRCGSFVPTTRCGSFSSAAVQLLADADADDALSSGSVRNSAAFSSLLGFFGTV